MKENSKRIPNFTQSEKQWLFNLICSKYAHILEDKKTNRTSIDEKNQAWKKIQDEFNASAPIASFRSSDSLKRCYENKKKDLRKKLADDKKNRFLTGGGLAPALNLDNTDEILLSIVNEKSLKGFEVECDSDANNFYEPAAKKKCDEEHGVTFTIIQSLTDVQNSTDVQNQECNDVTEVPVEEFVNHGKKNNQPVESDWSKYKSADLKSPPNPVLQRSNKNNSSRSATPRRRPTNSVRVLTSSDVAEKYNNLLDKRLLLVEKQLEQAVELQNFQREEHKLKFASMKIQQEIQMLEKEEKSLKVEILKLDIAYKKSLLTIA